MDVAEPIYLTDQSVVTIKARMRQKFLKIDASEGSTMGDFVDTTAVELHDMGVRAQLLHEQSYLSGATGSNLDARAYERNLSRNAAVPALVDILFTGLVGTVIPVGTRVSTVGTSEAAPVAFATTIAAVVGSDGEVTVPTAAVESGRAGNVAVETVVVLLDYQPGLASVENELAATGGVDTESDAKLRARVLYDVRTISAGGNVGDYHRWARDVDGVGGVTVVPQGSGPGTVDLYIVSAEGLVPTAAVVADVQAYIAPPYEVALEAEDTAVFARTGTVTDVNRADDTGASVSLAYQAGTASMLQKTGVQALLPRSAAGIANPGVWRLHVRCLADPPAGETQLFQIGVWNATDSAYAHRSESPASPFALLGYTGAQMTSAFGEIPVDFWWDGTDLLDLRLTRLLSDTTTTVVVVDRVRLVSSFSSDQVAVWGKAPIGARVTVYPAPSTPVDVDATVHVLPGYDPLTVVPAVEERLRAYLQLVAMDPLDKTVRYIPLGAVMFEVAGVEFVTTYRLNGDVEDLVMPLGGIGVAGDLDLTPA